MDSIYKAHFEKIDINDGLRRFKGGNIGEDDIKADRFGVDVFEDGVAVDLTGCTVSAYFIRPSQETATITGTAKGNQAYVNLKEECYKYPGGYSLALKLTHNGVSRTVAIFDGHVLQTKTDSVIDNDHVIPSLEEIYAAIDAVEAATDAANAAALSIERMTVVADTLEPGMSATVYKGRNGERGIQIRFGIPKGDKGMSIYNGAAITGTSVTPTAYATGIENALVGDLYANTGTDDANTGNLYECVQGGNASTALWVYKTNWRGAPGSGSVSTVDGVQPGGDGNVSLNAVRTVAQTLSESEKTQVQTNIGLTSSDISTIARSAVQSSIDTINDDIDALENKFQTGTVSVAVESDAVATQTVTFPKAFAYTPAVVVCLNTNASAVLKGGSCAPSGISATGFTINAYRPTVGNVPVRWIAFVP
jgi:hypothetical protein